MSIDLDFNPEQEALGEAIAQFCGDRWTDEDARGAGPEFPGSLWRELAGLGVLSAGAPGEESGALEVCAAMEALGAALFPGPLVGSFLAQQVLPSREASAIAEGRALVCFGSPPLLPWAREADLFIECAGGELYSAEPAGPVRGEPSPDGDAWGRVEFERGAALPHAARGLALAEIARAAYLAAAGRRLIAEAAEHARTRKQFGRAIGEFQAVAHPLADAHMRLEAARLLARTAACAFEDGDADRGLKSASTARLSAAGAALDAIHVGHQIFGAVGITVDGPAFYITRRIRSLVAHPPGSELARASQCDALGLAP